MEQGNYGRKVLIGAGNRLRGDDGAGSILGGRFSNQGWLSLDAGSMPESFTGIIKRERPSILVIVDSCDMGIIPGEFRRIPVSRLSMDYSFNTHRAPLGMFIARVSVHADQIEFIGIQPERLDLGEELSPTVNNAIAQIEKILIDGNMDAIPFLHC